MNTKRRSYDIYDIEDRVHQLELGGGSTPEPTTWDYSTTETDTKQKWTDGKEIYCKVLQPTITGSITVDQTITLGTIADVDSIIDMHCVVKSSNTNSPSGTIMDTGWIDSTGSVKIKPQVGYTNVTEVKAIVKYTKATAAKSTKRSKK